MCVVCVCVCMGGESIMHECWGQSPFNLYIYIMCTTCLYPLFLHVCMVMMCVCAQGGVDPVVPSSEAL